jgi:hypothetical protein
MSLFDIGNDRILERLGVGKERYRAETDDGDVLSDIYSFVVTIVESAGLRVLAQRMIRRRTALDINPMGETRTPIIKPARASKARTPMSVVTATKKSTVFRHLKADFGQNSINRATPWVTIAPSAASGGSVGNGVKNDRFTTRATTPRRLDTWVR